MKEQTWREKIAAVSIGASDAVLNAVREDLSFYGHTLTAKEDSDLCLAVGKAVRQIVRKKFIPKTHMD